MTNKKKSILVLLSLSLLLIVGCAKEESKKMTTLEEIKKRGTVIVGTEALVYPYEFVEDGKIVGYGSDILAEVVKSLGVKLEQHDVEWKGILPGLDAKKFDFIATAVAVTPERKEKYDLTTPIGEYVYVFSKNADNTELTSKEQLVDKKIGCLTGGTNEKHLTDYKEQLTKEGKPSFEIVSFKSTADAFIDLKHGRIDAVLCSETTANGVMRKDPEAYVIFDKFEVKEKEYVSWAVRKNDKELLEFINAEILKLKKSGKLAELQEKWFGYTFDLPDEI